MNSDYISGGLPVRPPALWLHSWEQDSVTVCEPGHTPAHFMPHRPGTGLSLRVSGPSCPSWLHPHPMAVEMGVLSSPCV